MTKRITVRLPKEIVDFVDGLMSEGEAKSRAVVVSQALERECRRVIATRDVALLYGSNGDPDMDRLAEHLAKTPLDLE